MATAAAAASTTTNGRRLSATRELDLTRFYFYKQRRQSREQVQEQEQRLLMLVAAATAATATSAANQSVVVSSQSRHQQTQAHQQLRQKQTSQAQSELRVASYAKGALTPPHESQHEAQETSPEFVAQKPAPRQRLSLLTSGGGGCTNCVSEAPTATSNTKLSSEYDAKYVDEGAKEDDEETPNYERCCRQEARACWLLGTKQEPAPKPSLRRSSTGDPRAPRQRKLLSLESDDSKSLESSPSSSFAPTSASTTTATTPSQGLDSRLAAGRLATTANLKVAEFAEGLLKYESVEQQLIESLTISVQSRAPPTRTSPTRSPAAPLYQQHTNHLTSGSFITSHQFRRSRLNKTRPSIEDQLKKLLDLDTPGSIRHEDDPKERVAPHQRPEPRSVTVEQLPKMKKSSQDQQQGGKLGNSRDEDYYQKSNTSSKYNSSLSPDDRMMIFMMASRRAAANTPMEKNARILKWLHNCRDAKG